MTAGTGAVEGEGSAVRPAVPLDREQRMRALSAVPLFADLPEEERWDVAASAHVLSFGDGDTIVAEGEAGLGFYVVLTGAARVERAGGKPVTLGPGEFFGEIALLEGGPRVASVVASGPSTCLGILRMDFRALLARNPRLALRILDEERRRMPDFDETGDGDLGGR